MIGTIDIEIQAKNPNLPLWPLRAYVNSPSSLRIRNVPKKIGQWEITSVQVNVNYPDKTLKTAQCVLVGGVWVGTIEGSPTAGSYTNGYTVLADGIDENGNPVSGYVLGRGDVEILKEDGTPIEDPTHFVTDDELDAAISGKAEISDVDDVANDLTDLSNSLSDYYFKTETSSAVELDAKLETKADLSTLNEVADSLSDYYTKNETSSATEIQTALDGKQPTGDYALSSQLPTKTSQLSNDSGYITSAQVEPDHNYIGFSKSSHNALRLYNINNGVVYDNLNSLWLDNGQPFVEGMEYYPWQLTKWFNDTFATPLQLEFKYIGNIQVPLMPSMPIPTSKAINQYGWIASSGQLTHYIIKAEHTSPNNPDYFEATAIGKFDAPSSNFMPITISNNLKSVETVNGESGVVTCTRTNRYKTTNKTLAFRDELSAKADLSALENYLPLSGDATANVVTNSLSADARLITGDPNVNDTIGPDEGGSHYGGVLIYDGCVDIQNTKATSTIEWYGTKIDAFGVITIKEKDAAEDVIEYDKLKLPKTNTQAYSRTIATQEWVLEQLSALEARIAALENN